MKLFVKELTVIDSSVLDYHRGIIGQSWLVDIVLHGELNDESMILDFGIVKKRIKSAIDELVDHKLIIPSQAEFCHISQNDEHTYIDAWPERGGSVHLACPAQAFALLPTGQISRSSVAAYLNEQLLAHLPANVQKLEISLRDEAIDGAHYSYSHGLRKHSGNCQRIAHGHRSMIEIFSADKRDLNLEAQWALRWQDIYLAEDCDLVEPGQLHLSHVGMQALTAQHHCFSYQAPQGLFQIAIHRDVVEILPTETTVENIAQYIADTLAPQCQQGITVYAYEGVGKGAIASA